MKPVVKPGRGIGISNETNQTLPNHEVYVVWEEG